MFSKYTNSDVVPLNFRWAEPEVAYLDLDLINSNTAILTSDFVTLEPIFISFWSF